MRRVLFFWAAVISAGFYFFTTTADAALWQKQRDMFEEKGICFNLVSTEDYITNLSGGNVRKDTWFGLLDFDMGLDTEKLGFWSGGNFFVYVSNVHGHKKPTGEYVGDMQGVNGNEAPRVSRLMELWYEQTLMSGRLSILGGIHDMNGEFVVSEYAGLFLNSAFGLTPTLANNVSVSSFPNPALGGRIKWTLSENLSILAGVYDGDPGDSSDHPHGPDTSWNGKGGTFAIGEVAWSYRFWQKDSLLCVMKVGFWHHSDNFEDVAGLDENDMPVPHDDNYGGYGIFDQVLWQEKENQGLKAFFMAGGAPKNRNTIDMHLAWGITYTGLFPGRDEDDIGFAVTRASLSDKQKDAQGLESGETTLETTYRFVVNPQVSLQPDIQYVMDPSADPAIKNATVFSLRCEIAY